MEVVELGAGIPAYRIEKARYAEGFLGSSTVSTLLILAAVVAIAYLVYQAVSTPAQTAYIGSQDTLSIDGSTANLCCL